MDIHFIKMSLFLQNGYDNTILLEGQLLNNEGLLLTYEEFVNKVGLLLSPKQYSSVFHAILSGIIMFS